jgi:hypothetical protein
MAREGEQGSEEDESEGEAGGDDWGGGGDKGGGGEGGGGGVGGAAAAGAREEGGRELAAYQPRWQTKQFALLCLQGLVSVVGAGAAGVVGGGGEAAAHLDLALARRSRCSVY